MKKIRYFIDALDGQERYLNQMAKKGYRLIKTTRMGYEFQPCEQDAYSYIVQYVAEKSLKELTEYRQYIEDLGFLYYGKNINMQYGAKARLRYTGKNLTLATNPGRLNQELLIIEIPKGQTLSLFTTAKEQYEYYAMLRNVYCVASIGLLLLALFGSTKLELFGHTYIDEQYLFIQIPALLIACYFLFHALKFIKRANEWKHKMIVFE